VIDAEREALRAAMQLPYPSFPCNALKRPTTKNGFKDVALPAHGLATLWLELSRRAGWRSNRAGVWPRGA
jgi:hypothetical protein